MKANVSVCIIVKNEPLLEDCLKSIRDYVEEIVIVDTGSTDNTPEIAQKYADVFEVYTGCNDPTTGLIEDFSNARQRSFDLATKPWIMWCDADDIILGGENLLKLTQEFESDPNRSNVDSTVYLFPYEYSHDDEGNCTCRHYRERLFYGKENFHWVNPVHEVAVPNENLRAPFMRRDSITYVHKRKGGAESGRNLRILRKYFEDTKGDDPRQMYYIGLECASAGLLDEAIEWFTKYIGLSGWDEERVMACLKVADIYIMKEELDNALTWAFKSIAINETWAECYFSAAKVYFYMASKNNANSFRNWDRCIYFINLGLSMPPTETVLFINPLEKEFEIYKYLSIACNAVGDVRAALNAANTGLKRKKDSNLLFNKKIFEDFLARKDIAEAAAILKDHGTITQQSYDSIVASANAQINNVATKAEVVEGQFPIAGTTSNGQEWYIPEAYDYESFPLRLTDEQLQATTIMLWKQYILHDEILLAEKFLQNAPYNVRNSPATVKALNATKAMTAWITDVDLAQKHNAPEVVEFEIGMPLPHPMNGQQGSRFDAIVDYLDPTTNKDPVSILDFGCFDGAFTNRYARLGYKVTGVDLVRSSIALANKKAEEFNTGAQHIECYFQDVANKFEHKTFDYCTSTESYEHLLDPVNDMLLPARKILKPTGKFLLSCPHGAWFRGNYFAWAHPWLWKNKDGNHWLAANPRGHLIAPDVWSLAAHFREAGYWVKNSFVMLSNFPDCPGQGNVFSEAHVQPPANYADGKDIIIYVGNGAEEWTPNTVKKTGIGGSETMVIEMAKRLALQGNKVRVYSSCGRWGEGIYDGVEYHQSEKYQDLNCDVLIVSRRAPMVDEKYNVKAKLKLLWVHDVQAGGATNQLMLKYDRILALSEWHKQNLITAHNLHPDHVVVTRNGIDLGRFEDKMKRNPHKVVNSSSPDRSWPILLECWPSIKQQVPDAELHLYYGFGNWESFARHDENQLNLIAMIKQRIKEFESLGVVFHDRVNQKQLAEEYLTAGVCAHPTWFTETSGITFMEAQAAGLRVVSSSIAALNETVADRGVLLPGDWTSPEYKSGFIQATVLALLNKSDADRTSLRQYAQEHFGLDALCKDWTIMFDDLLLKMKTDPTIPYQPTEAYK